MSPASSHQSSATTPQSANVFFQWRYIYFLWHYFQQLKFTLYWVIDDRFRRGPAAGFGNTICYFSKALGLWLLLPLLHLYRLWLLFMIDTYFYALLATGRWQHFSFTFADTWYFHFFLIGVFLKPWKATGFQQNSTHVPLTLYLHATAMPHFSLISASYFSIIYRIQAHEHQFNVGRWYRANVSKYAISYDSFFSFFHNFRKYFNTMPLDWRRYWVMKDAFAFDADQYAPPPQYRHASIPLPQYDTWRTMARVSPL